MKFEFHKLNFSRFIRIIKQVLFLMYKIRVS